MFIQFPSGSADACVILFQFLSLYIYIFRFPNIATPCYEINRSVCVSYIYLDFSKTCGALDNPGEKCSLSDRRREKKNKKIP